LTKLSSTDIERFL